MKNENTAAPAGAASAELETLRHPEHPWIDLETSVARAIALIELLGEQLQAKIAQEQWTEEVRMEQARSQSSGIWTLSSYVAETLWQAYEACHRDRPGVKARLEQERKNQP